jgi:hypothetical protein
MLAGWGLVPNAATALQLLAEVRSGRIVSDWRLGARCKGLVTRHGEVFKADGEIVAGPPPGHNQTASQLAYGVSGEVMVLRTAGGARAAASTGQQELNQQQRQLEQRTAVVARVSELERAVREASSNVTAAEEVLLEARMRVMQQERLAAKANSAVVAAEAAVKRLMLQHSKGVHGGQEANKLQLAEFRKQAQALASKSSAAQQRLAAAVADLDAARCDQPGREAAAGAQRAAYEAASAVEAAQSALACACRAASSAGREEAALRKQLTKQLDGVSSDSEAARHQVSRTQASVVFFRCVGACATL